MAGSHKVWHFVTATGLAESLVESGKVRQSLGKYVSQGLAESGKFSQSLARFGSIWPGMTESGKV